MWIPKDIWEILNIYHVVLVVMIAGHTLDPTDSSGPRVGSSFSGKLFQELFSKLISVLISQAPRGQHIVLHEAHHSHEQQVFSTAKCWLGWRIFFRNYLDVRHAGSSSIPLVDGIFLMPYLAFGLHSFYRCWRNWFVTSLLWGKK